jgi:hypothetical protein
VVAYSGSLALSAVSDAMAKRVGTPPMGKRASTAQSACLSVTLPVVIAITEAARSEPPTTLPALGLTRV